MQNTKDNAIENIANIMRVDCTKIKLIQVHKVTNIIASEGEKLSVDFGKAKRILSESHHKFSDIKPIISNIMEKQLHGESCKYYVTIA